MTQTTANFDHDQSHHATTAKAEDPGRCIFRYSNHSRCRLPALNHHSSLCFGHAKRQLDRCDLADLSADLFAGQPAEFNTPEQINDLLAKVVLLLAQGRISPRRAAVITFACSLLLRSVVVIDGKLSQGDDHSQVIADLRSWGEPRHPLPPSHLVLTEAAK